MLPPRELAIRLSRVDWMKIQNDDTDETRRLESFKTELRKLNKAEIIRVLTRVLEASVLSREYPDSFDKLLEFRYLSPDPSPELPTP
jgi:hypothetical protein